MNHLYNQKYGYLLDNINGFALDSRQRKVVYSERPNIIVIAGAGSGKTTTIVGKIKYLLVAQKLKPVEICCLSFTNESVKSLKEALQANQISDVKVTTFHKLALNILGNKYNIIADNYLEYIINEVLRNESDAIKKLILTIINLYKTQNLKPGIFTKIPKKYHNLIIKVLRILIIYESEKKAFQAIDFNDMIIMATDQVKNYNLKYIIIDEYQDSSLIRVNLIKKLVAVNQSKLLVVGDDWQSIYRFSGCNLDIFLHFAKYFKHPQKIKLLNTHRNSRELLKVTCNFIQKNPFQIPKHLKSTKSVPKPIKVLFYHQNKPTVLKKTLNLIAEKQILILGRNSFDLQSYIDADFSWNKDTLVYLPKKDLQIRYLTIHKAKGLESQNVILLNVSDERHGIPTQVEDAKILKYFNLGTEVFKFDEERRLFYVALTRTKNSIYLLVNQKNPSVFFKEILKNQRQYIKFIF